MKLSACIEWLFSDQSEDIAERIYLAKAAGLDGVEFHLWRDKPIDAIKDALQETGMTLTSLCVDPRRSIVDKSQLEEFLQAVKESAVAAKTLNCQYMIIASGFRLPDATDEEHFTFALNALRQAADIATEHGATLLLEPLNTEVDHPGMYLDSVSTGLNLVEAVNSPALRLVYDAYHSLVMGDDIATVLKGRMQWVAHIQVADMPGRGAPGTGNIDWFSVLNMLEAEGYQGWIGLEFKLNELSSIDAVNQAKRLLQQ